MSELLHLSDGGRNPICVLLVSLWAGSDLRRSSVFTCCREGGGVWVLRSWPYWLHNVTSTHSPHSSLGILALSTDRKWPPVQFGQLFPPAFSKSQWTERSFWNSHATAGLNFCLCLRTVWASKALGAGLLDSLGLWVCGYTWENSSSRACCFFWLVNT